MVLLKDGRRDDLDVLMVSMVSMVWLIQMVPMVSMIRVFFLWDVDDDELLDGLFAELLDKKRVR